MKCPVTGKPMMVVERNKIELDYSPASKGIWFDAGELELFADTLDTEITIPDYMNYPAFKTNEAPRKSPRTGKEMDKINLGSDEHPIIIDRDRDGLGLWFDHGELAQVLERFMKHDGDHATGKVLQFLSETIHY